MQIDFLHQKWSLSRMADHWRTVQAVHAGMAWAKSELSCAECFVGQGVPWETWPASGRAMDWDTESLRALEQRWQERVNETPEISLRCLNGLCALGRPDARRALDWLQMAHRPEDWSSGGTLDTPTDDGAALALTDHAHTRYWIEPWVVQGTDMASAHWLYRVTVLSRGMAEGTLSGAQAIWRPVAPGQLELLAWRWLQP